MKKVISLLLIALFLFGAVAMAATSPESGEEVVYADGKLSMYDITVFEAIPEDGNFRGIVIADHPAPAEVVKAVTENLLDEIKKGAVAEAGFVGMDKILDLGEDFATKPFEEQATLLMEKLADLGPDIAKGDGAQVFDAQTLANGSMESGYGTVMIDGVETPFLRIVVKLLYAPTGEYEKFTPEQRTFYENYNFTYPKDKWELYSIVRYSPAFFVTK